MAATNRASPAPGAATQQIRGASHAAALVVVALALPPTLCTCTQTQPTQAASFLRVSSPAQSRREDLQCTRLRPQWCPRRLPDASYLRHTHTPAHVFKFGAQQNFVCRATTRAAAEFGTEHKQRGGSAQCEPTLSTTITERRPCKMLKHAATRSKTFCNHANQSRSQTCTCPNVCKNASCEEWHATSKPVRSGRWRHAVHSNRV